MPIDIIDFPENSSGDLFGNLTSNDFIIAEAYSYDDDDTHKHIFSMGIMTRSRNPIQGYNAKAFMGLFASKLDAFDSYLINNKDEFIVKCKVAAYKALCEIAKFEDEYVELDLEHSVCMDFIIFIQAPTFRAAIACGNSWVVMHHDVNALPQRPKFTPVIIPKHKQLVDKVYRTIRNRSSFIRRPPAKSVDRYFRVFSQDKDLVANSDMSFMAVANRRILTMFNSSPKNFEKDVTDFIGCMMLRNNHSFHFWEKANRPDVTVKKNVVLMW